MDRLLEAATESEGHSSTFISLRNENNDTQVHNMLDKLPKYANSKVWQDMIKRKASKGNMPITPKKQNEGVALPHGVGFSHRSPMNATNTTGKKRHGAHSLTTRDPQAST